MPTEKQLKDYVDKRIKLAENEVSRLQELVRTKPSMSMRYAKQAERMLGNIAELRALVDFLKIGKDKTDDGK